MKYFKGPMMVNQMKIYQRLAEQYKYVLILRKVDQGFSYFHINISIHLSNKL